MSDWCVTLFKLHYDDNMWMLFLLLLRKWPQKYVHAALNTEMKSTVVHLFSNKVFAEYMLGIHFF